VKGAEDQFVTTDLSTLLTALYVKIDDWLGRPPRPGHPPKLSDAELLTLAVAQVLLGVRSEARWLRFVPAHLPGAFPYLPGQSGYNKRLRAALPLLARAIRALAEDTDLFDDLAWVVDSTPVECARSRPAVRRSALAGWAGYGYCPSHSRFFWGLRLHLVCTPAGLPVAWALASPKIDERQVLTAIIDRDQDLVSHRPGLVIIADKGYVSQELDQWLAGRGVTILRPTYRNLRPRPGEHLLKPVRQLIESVNDTLKGQLDLELHGGRTIAGVGSRIAQRLLALTAAIWLNRQTGQPVTRSLIAFDH
jgi:Transposase DDE domain